MSKYNILVKISGSIAAYKSAMLISKLIQNDFDVKVVVTKDALNFIGKATLEGLTGNEVYDDTFENGKMMNHINLVKWADLTILVPATANTINKMVNGIGDNLLTSLFLVHDFTKPYFIAPAMNTNMFEHPATQESFKKLKSWGVKILPTNEGYLACGDIGKGKLLDPDEIFELIKTSLSKNNNINKSKSILITAGGTKEYIDGVRYLTNLSTGKTASVIAEYFIKNGYNVFYIHSHEAILPSGEFKDYTFSNFDSLHNLLKKLLAEYNFELLIHNAAVSDFTIKEVIADSTSYEIPLKQKLDSAKSEVFLKLSPNFKIVNKLKDYSKSKKMKLVSFKFTNTNDEQEIINKINSLLSESDSDLVIQNDLSQRKNNIQENFSLFNKLGFQNKVSNANELSQIIENIFQL